MCKKVVTWFCWLLLCFSLLVDKGIESTREISLMLNEIFIFLQGASSPDPTTVFVDLRALRNDRVTLVEKGSPHSLQVMESGKVRVGSLPVTVNHGWIWEKSLKCENGYPNEIVIFLMCTVLPKYMPTTPPFETKSHENFCQNYVNAFQ